MPEPSAGGSTTILRGVDRAALAASFCDRLRRAGATVPTTAMADLCEALGVARPAQVGELYWSMRVTLVRRQPDLETFDRVFEAAFLETERGVDPHARRQGVQAPDPVVLPPGPLVSVPGLRSPRDESEDTGLPWHTLPRSTSDDEPSADGVLLPELLPSTLTGLANTPFEEFDDEQLAALGRWLERAAPRWPTRRSRRVRAGRRGESIALRQTIAASRRTGWEPLDLRRQRRIQRPRSLTLVTDVSASMQSYSAAYLHLMRAFARTGRAETFAFSTTLTRLTPALVQRSAETALELAEQRVVDRYGGTHLAGALRDLLGSRHGSTLRGGVLLVASDGWDSDTPDELRDVMGRLARRVRRIVWLNPRAGVPGFEPLVGSMSAALPYCDAFLPAHTVAALPDVFAAVAGVSSTR
jgi:uncharacterized protein with von Willebrand factor type A (vWA) domain